MGKKWRGWKTGLLEIREVFRGIGLTLDGENEKEKNKIGGQDEKSL
ncbi:MAG TPA: hypothetical protein PK747_07365 [Acidobacteriota bacterium]|nr:hypothetical protein [Acidobacteriota bacterium]HNT16287.1 hypothetical protein [Acidobacteriota bacterium]HPA26451.1 hypothetical protein [Acidobacteriota bacterium]HQO18827.1 hypothetical protein [Acidobacteriota bacterium]HQQ47212.1 hypothetical protein [Acidobacteriota bacterium]